MKALIIYDSFFGNTEQVARAIGGALGNPEDICVNRVSEVRPEQLQGLDLLIVGSPTRAFRPSEATQKFLKGLAPDALKGVRVAAFDTRMDVNGSTPAILRFFAKIFGFAAQPIAKRLKKSGGELVTSPEGFIVKDTEGPLKDGELERAAAWARGIA